MASKLPLAEPQDGPTFKHPKAVQSVIIFCEFCERFTFFAIRTVLVMFLHKKLMLEEGPSTAVFHVFLFLLYLCCFLVSATNVGKFRTILFLIIGITLGISSFTVAAIENWWNLSTPILVVLGVLLIAIGSGGVKPCMATFGSSLFELPAQVRQTARFFTFFYITINLAALLSMIVTPILREDVQCFGMKDCFPASFGLPSVLMIIAIVVFACGKLLYETKDISENMTVKVVRCICDAIQTRKREKKNNPKAHWLDYAVPRYGQTLVTEIKVVLNLLVLYLPIPLFWALFDQQASRWTFQATRMNGDLGFYVIKPDQMQAMNPLIMLTFVPLLTTVGVRHPILKIALGGTLAAVAFSFATFVQFKIDALAPNEISMLWQLPQYIAMTLGEVMFSVTGLYFSFTESPDSMKAVVAVFWPLSDALGNLFVSIVVSSRLFENQATEFLFFAVVMMVGMVIFLFLGCRYKKHHVAEIEILNEAS